MERRLNFGIVVGLISFAIEALVSTLVFPLLLKYLGKTDAGLWMLFVSLGALLQCFMSGLAPAVSRYVATVAGRESVGSIQGEAWAGVRISLTRVYGVALLVGWVIGCLLIPFYLIGVGRQGGHTAFNISVVWSSYLFGWGARAVIQRNFSALDGLGEVGYNRVVNTLGGITNFGILLWFLPMGIGVWAPVGSYVVVSLIVFLISIYLLREKAPAGWYTKTSVPWLESRLLATDALKMFVLGATSYVVGQSCILFVERGAGIATLATFAPVAKVVTLMAGAASMPNSMMIPYLARAFNANDSPKFRRFAWMSIFLAPLLYLLPALVLFIYPREIFGWWLGADNFVGEGVTRLMLLYGLVFCAHSGLAAPALAVRHRSFVRESVINMVLVLVLMPLFATYFGLCGYPLGMIIGTLLPSVMVCTQSIRFLKGRI